MPRYYIKISDGLNLTTLDPDGVVCSSLEEAEQKALSKLSALVSDHHGEGRTYASIVIRDEGAKQLSELILILNLCRPDPEPQLQ